MSFESIAAIEDALAQTRLDAPVLYQLWDARKPVAEKREKGGAHHGGQAQFAWMQQDVKLARKFTEHALREEEFLLVCDAAQEALRLDTDGDAEAIVHLARVRMNYAGALTRLGSTRQAQHELEVLLAPAQSRYLPRKIRAEVFSMLGDVLREESHHAPSPAARTHTLEQALGHYRQALKEEAARIDAAIHAAAVLLILQRNDEAQTQALAVIRLCDEQDASAGGRTFLSVAARAAAHAVIGEIGPARRIYTELKELPGVTTPQLAEARYRARLLAEARGELRSVFDEAFPPLQLIVFSGHVPDLPDKRPRFPASRTEEVRGLIRERLAQLNGRVGLVGASAGADLLFIEEMRARGGTVHVMLPWSREEYLGTSVRPFDAAGGPGKTWEASFHEALKHAATVRELGQIYQPGDPAAWQYLMEVTAGLAQLTAQASRLDVQPLALWDGQPGRAGGTADFHAFWNEVQGCAPEVIVLPALSADSSPVPEHISSRRSERPIIEQEVKSMLFADIVGYSKLTEQVLPVFVREFLGRVSEIVSTSAHAPISVNTWGDAVYAVFDRAEDAGNFALELVQMIAEARDVWTRNNLAWEEKMPNGEAPRVRPLSVRIGLHTGPVYMHFDPVVRRLGFTGAHVNRAARIEPVAVAGEVYASEEFASLATLNHAKGFACEFAGTMSLAKGFPGRHRIYRVLRVRELPVEALARAAHGYYCQEARARGETGTAQAALRPWEELPEGYREANRGQVRDIPNKLHVLGYELAPAHGLRASEIVITDAQLEQLAMREHDRWMSERLRNGWTYAPVRDNATKKHPLLVPWEQLNEIEKEKDRDAVRNVPKLLALAGFRVRPLAEPDGS